MSRPSAFADVMERSLSCFWSTVEPLEVSRGTKLFQSFCQSYVRPDFRTRFVEDFDRKPITKRFFEAYELQDIHSSANIIFGRGDSAELEVEVLWGSFENPVAFYLRGRASTFDRIFVSEGDSIAKVSHAQKIGFLFLSGQTGELFRFPEQLRQSAGSI